MNEDIVQVLKAESDRHKTFLDGMRKHVLDLQIDALKKKREFMLKIGELSLLAAAAIGPLIIASRAELDKQDLQLVFWAVGAYLFSGILALWRVKAVDEQELNTLPHVMSDTEADVLRIVHAYDQLIPDHENIEKKKRLGAILREYIRKYGDGGKKPKNKITIDISSDLALSLFCLATLLILGVIWPFTAASYWVFFALAVAFLLIIGLISYFRAREESIKAEQKNREISEIYSEQTQWQLELLSND